MFFCREDERRTAFFVTPIIKGFYEKLCLRFLLICQVKYLLKTVFFLGFLDACITQFPNRTMLIFSVNVCSLKTAMSKAQNRSTGRSVERFRS